MTIRRRSLPAHKRTVDQVRMKFSSFTAEMKAPRKRSQDSFKTLGLEPVILHEQANLGRTIIEKFEDHAHVGFAVALLTPDDAGSLQGEENSSKPRARQNVIFEFGYFIGKLGRERVCALVKGDVEKPSDYDGVLYISLNDPNDWKIELIKELKAAGDQRRRKQGIFVMNAHIHIPRDEIAAFCKQWQITELALFGSVLRDDFGPESDVDVLVRFKEEARHTLFDLDRMEEELTTIFGRKVDLVSWRGIEQSQNYIRRKAILQSAETIYVGSVRTNASWSKSSTTDASRV